ncbi:MAG TPA: HAMP domain-containing protein, partial [Pyrinomonadaceae bacterium]|nr:HAMP domain-containing protein [Pyrinomonadaceae bacterium]
MLNSSKMASEKNKPDRRKTAILTGIFVVVSFVVLFLLQTSNLWKDFSVQTASDTLLLYALSSLNFFAFIIFGFIFLRSVLKLVRERRQLQLGSRIKTRLFLYFFAISLLPIVAMAGFSYLFMNRAIERWFSQIPENVLTQARDEAIADHAAGLLRDARALAAAIGGREVSETGLREIAEAANLSHIEVVDSRGNVVAAATRLSTPGRKAELDDLLAKAKGGSLPEVYINESGGFDAVTTGLSEGRKLRIIPDKLSGEIAGQSFQESLVEFDRMKERQITVRQLGFLTLGVLTFLLIFASSWTAIYVARGLTDPIKALAEGAREIARGNLGHRVDAPAEDELALLVGAFNEMSGKLEESSAEIRERRRYIETVLDSLPTGVVSLDADGRVTTINRAAVRMLKLETADFKGLELATMLGEENRRVIETLVSRASRIGHASDQTQLRPENETSVDAVEIPVAITATALENEAGAVVVIEDLSELIAAQRASAWQEVARRMAHEIKNPLTPIQLSAERIAKRFAESNGTADDIHTTDGQTVKVIRDGTSTIIREVQSLKTMVDEFSRFARLPNAKPQPGDLNDVVRQAAAMYEDRGGEARLEVDLAEGLPPTMLDAEQIKRVFVNLIENA